MGYLEKFGSIDPFQIWHFFFKYYFILNSYADAMVEGGNLFKEYS